VKDARVAAARSPDLSPRREKEGPARFGRHDVGGRRASRATTGPRHWPVSASQSAWGGGACYGGVQERTGVLLCASDRPFSLCSDMRAGMVRS
jgi:hypothetical protein